jgi:hypothetical protein
MSAEPICPYPGLRPFNDEESIFFKGRDRNITTIIELFEKKKFIMLTGASGDGKSSLVYAGVIPNARAGFFKAKFNSWVMVDFRPERTPLQNMARALAKGLGYEDEDFVEKELGYGFSSLISLYKNSPYYLDTESSDWKNADEKTRKGLKRKAANLFILVDQFEEFFTYSENYQHGSASMNSQTVVNLLLETARIALEQDIPIYIICTMRSDYIGQCAAFRGLPEYIGFSQFFVPRLKRQEIHQVIEEPALLSGNRISNRLTETLINELGEGFDQLPVLQHALNQIWNEADKGREEMDLIHLSKLAGLKKEALPPVNQDEFSSWFEALPEFKKAFFHNESLENVLNAHANTLFYTACERYNATHQTHPLTTEEAAFIIKTTFQSLTKIDDSRAVRNRMTLEEVVRTIDQSYATMEVVGELLEIFRLPGNTFLKPFITEHESDRKLHPESILDITHESLIRNWDLLDSWAKEEYENWLNFQDFNKQLKRWVENGKSKGFLLPIGPLTFFENWYASCQPNAYWLARYDNRELTREDKLREAQIILDQADEFLRLSSRRLFFSKKIMKHGAPKIISYLGSAALLIVCTFFYLDFRKKQNTYIIEKIKKWGVEMLASNKVNTAEKAAFLINYERISPGSFAQTLEWMDNDTLAFDVADNMFSLVQNLDSRDSSKEIINPLIYPLLSFMDERLNNLTDRQRLNINKKHSVGLSRINHLLSLCAYVKSYDNSRAIGKLIDKNAWVLDRVLHDLLNLPVDSLHMGDVDLNNGLQLLISLAPRTDFSGYVTALSPLEGNGMAKLRFDHLYPRRKSIQMGGFYGKNLPFNGGYQLLSLLYAAERSNENGKYSHIVQCIDSNLTEDPLLYSFNDKMTFGGFPVILNVLVKYNAFSQGRFCKLVNYYTKISSDTDFGLLDQLMENNVKQHIGFWRVMDDQETNFCEGYCDCFVDKLQREWVWNCCRNLILNTGDTRPLRNNKLKDPAENELNFRIAMFYKNKGLAAQDLYNNLQESFLNFDTAFIYYSKIGGSFLNGDYTKPFIWAGVTNSFSFLYPQSLRLYAETKDINNIGFKGIPEGFYRDKISYSAPFLAYIKKTPSVSRYYNTQEGVKVFEGYCHQMNNSHTLKARDSFFACIEQMKKYVSDSSSFSGSLDPDFMLLAEINLQFEKADTLQAMQIFSKLNLRRLAASRAMKDFQRSAPYNSYNKLAKELANHLALNGYLKESFLVLNLLSESSEKRNTLLDIAASLQKSGPVENTFIYLDSLFKNNDLDGKPKFGLKLIRVLAMVGSQPTIELASEILEEVPGLLKQRGIRSLIIGIASNGFYYNATKAFPEYITSNKKMELYNTVLEAEISSTALRSGRITKTLVSSGWESYDMQNSRDYGIDYEILKGNDLKFDSLD